ncbi:DUF4192 family protein [Nesterenkonia sp.]|uniref:DUF4192 family protein n=1 Tax=Nesterenkonia sp. TaxID=704201 RepID=UPI00262DA11C|nr:DUF4192 family protein [Nesterenkonia sp.]
MADSHTPLSEPEKTPTLSVDAPGDALALVCHSFGRLPEDSLVLIGLLDGCTGGHLRMDFSAAAATPETSAEQAADWLAGPQAAPAPQAVMALVFTEERPSPGPPPGQRLMQSITEHLEGRYAAPLVQAWLVGAGCIRDFWCRDRRCCPYPGLDAEQLLAETLQRVPQLSGPGAPSGRQVLDAFLTAQAPPEAPTDAQVAAAAQDGGRSEPEVLLSLWDIALRETVRAAAPEWAQQPQRLAAMLGSLASDDFAQALPVLAAEGPETALAGRLAVNPHSAYSAAMAKQCAAVLCGETGSAPDWSRIEAFDALLQLLISYTASAADPRRTNMVSLKAWVEWAKGCGTAASAAVEHCLRHQPEHGMARSLAAAFELIGPCAWARVKQHSYSWWRTSTPAEAR